MKILLTGNDLTVEKVWEIAVEGAQVEISPEAGSRLEAARRLVYELASGEKLPSTASTGALAGTKTAGLRLIK